VLNKGGRFPVAFAVNAEKLIGESLEYYKHFEQETAKPANREKMSIMRFSSSLDIF